MQKFEYATLVLDSATFTLRSKFDHEAFHKRLNEYGSEGWELVNVFTLSKADGAVYEVTAVFKRPLAHSAS